MGGYGLAGAPPLMPPPPPDVRGSGSRNWLWGLGGALIASAVWAVAVFAVGGFGGDPKPDLAGYSYRSNLCSATDSTPFEDAGFDRSEATGSVPNPDHHGSQYPTLDSMTCNLEFSPTSDSADDYSSAWVYTSASLHKKTDPQPEFEAQYRSYENQETSTYTYTVKNVTDIGDEAYLVTQRRTASSSSDGGYLILAVRDGWMTYSATWSEYVSSSSSASAVSDSEATEMLKKSAEATLAELRR